MLRKNSESPACAKLSNPACAKLNVFQRVMIQWTNLHPYNAVHAYRLAGQLDQDRLKQAIRGTYQTLGMGVVEILPTGRFHHESTDLVEIEVLDGGSDATTCLTRQVASELNRPFPRPKCQPIRFRVVTEGDRTHYLLVAYDHWIADSVAIRLILRHVLGHYCRLEIPENDRPLQLYPATYRAAFRRHFRPWKLATAALRSATNIVCNRSAALFPYSSIEQMAVGFDLLETAPGTVDRLQHFSRSQDATVHDVILAALSRAVTRCLPRRSLRQGTRKTGRKLVTGTIVDTRGDADLDLQDTLGTFLAYYQVPCRPDEHKSLASLTRSIAAATRSIKQRRQYLDSLLNMQFANQLWPYLSSATKPRFLRRAIPMIGGVSNIRLCDPWVEQCVGDHPFGYVRAAPTGPMLPFVLTPTTLQDRMNLGVTYRLTAFSQAKLQTLMESILDDLQMG